MHDKGWETAPSKPDNASKFKPSFLVGLSKDVEMKADPVQIKIDRIQLHNLKVDIANTVDRIDVLLQKKNQKRQREIICLDTIYRLRI